MAELSFDNILLWTIFFVPGFVYLKFYRLLIADIRTNFSRDLFEAIGISLLNTLIFSYPLYLIHSGGFIKNHPVWYLIVLVGVVVVGPIILCLIFYFISKQKWFIGFLISPNKSAWDEFFSKRESYYVVVTLKNGRKIGGKYGLNSFSSTYPIPKEIYLEEVWRLNDKNGFEEIVSQTEGILISENEISTIEFYI
ncbi:MAG: hypothetical protein KJO00_12200 [Bacteroidia bacterium]|nr:hypothetical protein [Bacteroidia bacterium]